MAKRWQRDVSVQYAGESDISPTLFGSQPFSIRFILPFFFSCVVLFVRRHDIRSHESGQRCDEAAAKRLPAVTVTLPAGLCPAFGIYTSYVTCVASKEGSAPVISSVCAFPSQMDKNVKEFLAFRADYSW